LGYVEVNVVGCCKRCNIAKGNRFTYDEWYGMTEYFRRATGELTCLGVSSASAPKAK
jgi:hypothetical protein